MNKNLIIFSAIISIFLIFFNYTKEKYKMIYEVSNIGDLFDLFPKTPEQIRLYKDKCIKDLDEHIKKIIEIPDNRRTFDNTAKAFDRIAYYYQPVHSTLQALELLSPKDEIRNAAHEEVLKLTNYFVDNVSTNVKLYKIFKNYIDENTKKENLNETQKYFLNETMKDFKRNGLDLPTELLEKVRKLNKEIAEISLQFEANIAQDKTVISISKDELKGLKEDFINSLKKVEDMYVLGCDYPTYNNIMENCEIESTRKKLYIAFFNRACPININLLNELINKRDEFAKLLGFKDYCHFALDGQMAKEPEKVYYFLNSLIAKAYLKKQNELNLWKSDLPESVTLTEDGKIKPWDLKFIKTYYKKKHLSIDEQKVSEFFPMEHTIKQLLRIYEEFLSIKFKEVPITGFWHEDIKLIEAYDTNEQLLGYLLLDLYPRDNKFSHAAHSTIISCVRENNKLKPSVGIVMANFPKPTLTQPSLLKFKDVKTFFHEFGHAIHALLGCSEFYSFSGTNVKRDFVEMPSQMLENWLNDNEILKMISRYYKTEEHLPDDLISKIVELEKFDSGDFVLHQTYYGLLSLDYYGSGINKDSQAISKSLYNKILNYLLWTDDEHIQASFGHLTEYGPSYYGYLWSQVYAKDLFYEIKKHGLLNPEIGKKYIKEVIGQGGSKDPNELLKNFLGREPKEDAFFRDLGLN